MNLEHASVALVLFCGGCTMHGATEARARPPVPVTAAPASARVKELRIDADPEAGHAILEATARVLHIFAEPEFEIALKAEPLRAKPGKDLSRTESASVASYVTSGLPEVVTIIVRPQGLLGLFGLGATQATTAPDEGVISVSPGRVAEWDHGRSGLLINTLAHELTHLKVVDGRPAYVDGARKTCEEATLVSYRVGDLAQCYYEAGGERGAFERCAALVTNGVADRPKRLHSCDAPK